MTAQLTFTSVN